MAKKKRTKKIDWIKIKQDYLFNNLPLTALAKKYGVAQSSVNKHCREEKWVNQREAAQQKIDAELTLKNQEKEIERKIAKNEEHIKLYDDGITVVQELLEVFKEKMRSNTNKKRLPVNPMALEKVFSCIEKAQKGQRLALNIENIEKDDIEPAVTMVENLDLNKL